MSAISPPKAVRLDIPLGTLEAAPKMIHAEHAEMRHRNRERYAADLAEPRPVAASTERPRQDTKSDLERPGTPATAPVPSSETEDWRS
jgi:hypothetical protein